MTDVQTEMLSDMDADSPFAHVNCAESTVLSANDGILLFFLIKLKVRPKGGTLCVVGFSDTWSDFLKL